MRKQTDKKLRTENERARKVPSKVAKIWRKSGEEQREKHRQTTGEYWQKQSKVTKEKLTTEKMRQWTKKK